MTQWRYREEQITESDFTFRFITMRSKKPFAEVTGEIERLFQPYDLDKLSESKLYLIGSVITGQGLFRYSGVAGLEAPVRFCVSQRDGEDTRIDIDRPTSFHSQFPELSASTVPAEKDARMLPLLATLAGIRWPD